MQNVTDSPQDVLGLLSSTISSSHIQLCETEPIISDASFPFIFTAFYVVPFTNTDQLL